MKIRPLETSIATLLFAPDTEGAPAGGATPAIAISAADSPTGNDIPVTPRTQSSPPVILQEPGTQDPKTALRIRQKGVETSAAKLLGLAETPQEVTAREAKEFRDRDKTGRFVKTEIGKKKDAPPVEPPKLGEPTPVKPAPVVKPPAPPAPVVAKIKVGDKELTPDEAAARIAELEKAAKPPEPTPVATPAPDEAAVAAESKAREDKFLTDRIADYLLDAKDGGEYDQLLAGGEKGAQAFARMLAKVEMRARQYAASQLTKAYDAMDGITGRIDPVLQQQNTIAQYQSEGQFMDSNPDIKAHATGLQTMREVSHELHARHDDLLALMAANPTSVNMPRYQAEAAALEGDNFLPELAKATKARLNIVAPATPAVPATVPPVAAPVIPATPAKARPPATTGTIGGQGTPRAPKGNDGGFSELANKGFF